MSCARSGAVPTVRPGAAAARGPEAAPAQLDYPALLAALDDLWSLARFPVPAYVTGLASSRDPASVAPGEPGWFDNKDRGQFVREELHGERTESVLADLSGPGVVTRLWAANPAGTLRVYIDGASTPALETDMKALLGGEALVPAPLAMVTARGYTLHLPLPFRRRCVITTDRGKGLYYQVHFRRYAAGVALPSLSAELLRQHAAEIARAAQALQAQQAQQPLQAVPGERTVRAELSAAAPVLEVPADALGSALFELRFGSGAAEALRDSRLQLAFDGEAPQVDVPALPFFGVAPDPVPNWSLPLRVHADGTLESRWVMPFARGLLLRLTNAPTQPVSVSLRVAPARFEPGRSMHLHAAHQHARGLSTAEPFDFPLLRTEARGVYLGNLLHVFNPSEGWWGEGDEKIYVDGEAFPSHFGTGTEDYYGYAWASTERFEHAFHGQSRADGPKNAGHVANTRFHIPDPIPFQRELRFDQEVRHWQKVEGLELEVVNYWYAVP